MSFHFLPENTKVLLVGTTQYNSPEFAPITPAMGNIHELRRIFLNKDIIGVPNRNINTLINPNIDDLLKALKRLKSDPNVDTFVFYYVGHGYIMYYNGQNRWFITAKDSVADMNDYEYVKRFSLEYDTFKKYVESIGQKRIVIFDACYSGQATQSTNTITKDIKGTFTISSASANEQSLFDPSDEYTYFTKELIKIFNEGVKINNEFLSINEIYEELYERIEKHPNLPKPTQRNNFSQKFNLAKNTNFLNIKADLTKQKEAELKKKQELEKKQQEEKEKREKEEQKQKKHESNEAEKKKEKKLTEEQQRKKDWENTKKINSEKTHIEFITKYKTGKYIPTAIKTLNQLKKEAEINTELEEDKKDKELKKSENKNNRTNKEENISFENTTQMIKRWLIFLFQYIKAFIISIMLFALLSGLIEVFFDLPEEISSMTRWIIFALISVFAFLIYKLIFHED